MATMITAQEYRERMARLQKKVSDQEIDVFLVSQEESIYYLTGVSYRPLERPFFILVWPDRPADLLVPALEGDHLKAAPNVGGVSTYWEYPSPAGEGYAERLASMLIKVKRMGVEPGLSQEIATHLPEKEVNLSCYQRKLMEQARTKRATLSSNPRAVTA